MSNITTLHEKAMELSDLGILARRRGEAIEAVQFFRQALELEREAASRVPSDAEPTRSILYRSAATLALDSGETREAERLIAMALSGNPSEAVAEELRDLLERVYFQRHLELRGVELSPLELQLSISGRSVDFGMAPSEEVISRVLDVRKLLIRTQERKAARPYRKAGRPGKDLAESMSLYMSVPRTASFAITLRIGHQQASLFTEEVVDEVLNGLKLIEAEKLDDLRELITDEDYYRNFVAVGKRIAPDGEEISSVGFTVLRDGKVWGFSLERPGREIEIPAMRSTDEELEAEEVEVIRGELRFADSISKDERIKILTDKGEYEILVTGGPMEGLMEDIVRPLWGQYVIARVRRNSKSTYLLDDIERVRE